VARLRSKCSAAAGALCALIAIGCQTGADAPGELTIVVGDVGQGLAQIIAKDGVAVGCDMGPAGSGAAWSRAYRFVQKPILAGLIVSHTGADHVGGLGELDSLAAFSGIVYLSPLEDSTRILAQAGAWAGRLQWRRRCAGDTIGGLDGVRIDVLWPDTMVDREVPLDGVGRNRYSLVVRVVYGHTSALLTGDIDTVATKSLSATYAWGLRSQLVVAPHHGSAGSVDRVFYAYVSPENLAVSCGKDNGYGHPSESLIDVAFEVGMTLHISWQTGDIIARSQGHYWVLR
jgi:competence protein ComEC